MSSPVSSRRGSLNHIHQQYDFLSNRRASLTTTTTNNQRRLSATSLLDLKNNFFKSAKVMHHQLQPLDVTLIAKESGLDEMIVEEKFAQFVSLCEGKPSKGLNERGFQAMYKRAFPCAINPTKLANSVFRLCDRDNDNVIDFAEFVASLCIPPTRISTYQKFCTLFLIWDYTRVGYLTPGSLIVALKDVYDILGLFTDHHKDAMRLFGRMKKDRHCRVYMADFARVMMTDATMVKLMEGCNFCVPSTDVYMGPSVFWK